MVSPAQKQGAFIEPDGLPGIVNQAAASGGAMTYLTNVPTEEGVPGFTNLEQVLSTRGPDGWSSKDLDGPHNGATGQSEENGFEYRFFSEDLSQGIVQPFGAFLPCHSSEGAPQPCLSPHASEQTPFTRDLSTGIYSPLVTGCPEAPTPCDPAVREYANVPDGTVFGQVGNGGGACPPEKFCGPFALGASPDARHVVFSYGEDPAAMEEWNAAKPPAEQLQPVSVLPPHEGKPEELTGGFLGSGFEQSEDARGAISDDGSRVFWSSSRNLYLRDVMRKETIEIGAGNAGFQFASRDGSRVFFSGAGGLEECEVREGAGGNLECEPVVIGGGPTGSVIGGSEDGSYMYFVSGTSLLMEHLEGGEYKQTLIAKLSSQDNPDWADGSAKLGTLTAREALATTRVPSSCSPFSRTRMRSAWFLSIRNGECVTYTTCTGRTSASSGSANAENIRRRSC